MAQTSQMEVQNETKSFFTNNKDKHVPIKVKKKVLCHKIEHRNQGRLGLLTARLYDPCLDKGSRLHILYQIGPDTSL